MKIYLDNGLPFYTAEDLRRREYVKSSVVSIVVEHLTRANNAWVFHQIEAPCLIPNDLVSSEYTDEDVFRTQDFTLKPETTSSSYEYAKYLIEHQLVNPPFCIWQFSKSFRRENDQVSQNMRFKEFYQLEFQCIVSEGTLMNYQTLAEPIAELIGKLTHLPARVVESDRLPHYSEKTLDIELKTPHKWLEVCSISKRNDVPFLYKGKNLINYEFAFGLDRLVNV